MIRRLIMINIWLCLYNPYWG
ncbi:hypothetical protein [Plasmodium yoelii yoelii]|uniref:Uncharacterized protein n=1 Tax=Plasmodium yoelii yoelii TaxID=73239 RepID=Q7REE5_PLAYO|nr:hypothetical protein [Plasmodium yoelii yoelii]